MEEGLEPGLDPGLLQAVLADPVLLQAVDPQVLQAVLVTAAAANLVNTEGEIQAELEEAEDFSLEPSQSQSRTLGHRLGGAFNLASPSQTEQQPSLVSNNNRFGAQAARQGKLGSAFSDVDSPSSEFPQQNTIQDLFSSSSFHNFPQAPQFSSPGRKTFGSAFNTESQTNVIGPQPQSQPQLPTLNTDVELFSQEFHQLDIEFCHH